MILFSNQTVAPNNVAYFGNTKVVFYFEWALINWKRGAGNFVSFIKSDFPQKMKDGRYIFLEINSQKDKGVLGNASQCL
jgi:hypothetical protein